MKKNIPIFVLAFTVATLLAACGCAKQKNEEGNTMYKYTNHLIHETSPYLLQHAHNPVDWYPWGAEAFAKAKKENKPILLSVGYAACHWCHVMEEESFTNEQTAKIMNDLFINIKVDREERPDVDQVYMTFLQMTTGSGGWPMTVFLTPDQKPFYGGTYFPAKAMYGRPGFTKVLKEVSDFYQNHRQELKENLQKVDQAFRRVLQEESAGSIPDRSMFNRAVEELSRYYEPDYGGIGHAPKFPAVQALSLFLRKYHNDGQSHYLQMVTNTLDHMGRGGIYDQIGGGFARYSTDEQWLVPHFEKMLYDNAQLVMLYLDAYQLTKNPFYARIVRGTLQFVMNELYATDGGFYSSLDADSEGEEGRYYVWSRTEVLNLLGNEKGRIFCAYFDITEKGNFEGKNILHVVRSFKELAAIYNRSESQIEEIIEEGKHTLRKARQKRVAPARDDKVIVSWNGLMLSAFARASAVLGDSAYSRIVEKNITFLKKELVKDGELFHTYKDRQAKYSAYLDDYANLIQGLIDAYQIRFDLSYISWALKLTDFVNEHFLDKKQGGYFFTSDRQDRLIERLKDKTDQSLPSGTGTMLANMLRLYSLTDRKEFLQTSEHFLAKYGSQFIRNPYGYGSYLNALDFYLNKPVEIVLSTENNRFPESFYNIIYSLYLPNKVLVYNKKLSTAQRVISPFLTEGREPIDHKPTAYICQNFTCSLPIVDEKELKNRLLAAKTR